ncbi:MAG TPA: YggS family pyridoxal phosphate-dependent enzyme [Xanthomonadales bacterium]|nr:YggS family pyridoxal phosphate-dependent enzyme [Xanthomonadales bacterium]
MNDLKAKLNEVRARIASACQKADRNPDSLSLLAVSKRHGANSIRALFIAGQRHFGENYLQEALKKQQELADLDVIWHFIGPLQSNKTRDVAMHFHWVQSVDRQKLLRRLSEQRPDDMPPLNICLQVNIDAEPQKAGASADEIPALAQLASSLPGLRLRGLMAIPAVTASGETNPQSLARMKTLFDSLQDQGYPLDTLSMGMSADLEAAILAGSTMVRIGTDLFGPRD